MSFQQSIPWRVALQQSSLLLSLPNSFCYPNPRSARSFHRTVTVESTVCLIEGRSPEHPSSTNLKRPQQVSTSAADSKGRPNRIPEPIKTFLPRLFYRLGIHSLPVIDQEPTVRDITAI